MHQSIHCQQFVYGKLVKSLDGPIASGHDYGCTGKSTAFPSEVVQYCTPTSIGPGVDDLTPWRNLKWFQEGGFAIQPVSVATCWVVAGLVRGRSEAGEGKLGRIYHQAHYIAMPAKDFHALTMVELLQHLDAKPMVEKNFDLSSIKVLPVDVGLPQDWLTTISPFVRMIMSGHSISLQDSTADLNDITTLFQLIIAVLPRSLQWRLGVRLGCWEMRQEVGLAHGQRAMSGVRLLKDKLKGFEQLPLDSGDYYLQWLDQNCASCQTVTELQETIEKAFSKAYEWDYFPLDKSWNECAVDLAKRLREQDLLQQITADLQPLERLAPQQVEFFRLEYLQLLLHKFPNDLAATYINECCNPDWSAVWQQLPGNQYLFHFTAFGMVETLTSKVLEQIAVFDFPLQNVDRVTHSLSAYLSNDPKRDSILWLPALTFNESLQPWFKKWRKAEIYRLFWIALEWKSLEYPELFIAGENLPPWRLLRDIQNGRSFSEQEGRSLIESAISLADLDIFLQQIWSDNPVAGLQLLGWASEDLPFIQMLDSTKLYDWEHGVRSALKIWLTFPEPNDLLMRILLAFVDQLSGDVQGRIKDRFRSELGPLFAFALWQEKASSGGRYEDLATRVLGEKITSSPEFEDRVFRTVMQASDQQMCRRFATWYYSLYVQPNANKMTKFAHFLSHLVHEKQWTKAIIHSWSQRLAWLKMYAAFASIFHLKQFVDIKACTPFLPYCSKEFFDQWEPLQISQILRSDEQEIWQQSVANLQLEKSIGWRLIHRLQYPEQEDCILLNEDENAVIESCSIDLHENFMDAGVVLEASMMNAVLAKQEPDGFSIARFGRWLSLALKSPDEGFVVQLGRCLMRRNDEVSLRATLRQRFLQPKTFFDKVASVFHGWKTSVSHNPENAVSEEAILEILLCKVDVAVARQIIE